MLIKIITFLTFLSYAVDAARILAVLTFPAKSHYAIVGPLLEKLAERGHHVTEYSHHTRKGEIANYQGHDLGACDLWPIKENKITIDMMNKLFGNPLVNVFIFAQHSLSSADTYETCKPLYNLMNSTEKYDLFITETFSSDLNLMYAAKLNIPFVTYIPNGLWPWLADRMRNPLNPSYVPNLMTGLLPRMNFFERVSNTLTYMASFLSYEILVQRHEDAVNEKFMGERAPSLYDLVKNTSVLFTATHSSINTVTPLVPAIVEIGGIHIKPSKSISQNIEKFINESKHGVVYFCMGSLLRGDTFPKEKLDAFLYAFSKIPQRVLWKYEGDTLPGKSDNIMISKWMPQRDILAHPNIKLFISHGGLLGTSEAVYEGVPVLGIPIFGDQRTNIRSLEANGAGELLDYNEISKEVVLERILKLTNDPKYKENAKALSDRYRDRPMSPLDTAVYWTEYVIRHKGAPHLKSAAVELTWYQYLLLDVIAFIVLVLAAIIFVVYYTLKLILKGLCYILCGSSKSSKSSSSKSSAKSSKKTN